MAEGKGIITAAAVSALIAGFFGDDIRRLDTELHRTSYQNTSILYSKPLQTNRSYAQNTAEMYPSYIIER